MHQPILVPLDGSALAEQALPYAQALAGPGCELILLEVGQDDDDLTLRERHADSCGQLETAIGDPAEEILRVATQMGAGMIVMTTRGRGAVGRWAFGSVADRVARTAPVPVLVVRPREDVGEAGSGTIRRLVVPLDGSPLAEAAVSFAQFLAKDLTVPVHLVTAIDVASLVPTAVAPVVAFDAALYDETVTHLRADAEARDPYRARGRSRRGSKRAGRALRLALLCDCQRGGGGGRDSDDEPWPAGSGDGRRQHRREADP